MKKRLILLIVLSGGFLLKANCQTNLRWITEKDEIRISKQLDTLKVLKVENVQLRDSLKGCKVGPDSTDFYKRENKVLRDSAAKHMMITKGYRAKLDVQNNKVAGLEQFKRKVWVSPTERKLYWVAIGGLSAMCVLQGFAQLLAR